jgi:hypothetical protein
MNTGQKTYANSRNPVINVAVIMLPGWSSIVCHSMPSIVCWAAKKFGVPTMARSYFFYVRSIAATLIAPVIAAVVKLAVAEKHIL